MKLGLFFELGSKVLELEINCVKIGTQDLKKFKLKLSLREPSKNFKV